MEAERVTCARSDGAPNTPPCLPQSPPGCHSDRATADKVEECPFGPQVGQVHHFLGVLWIFFGNDKKPSHMPLTSFPLSYLLFASSSNLVISFPPCPPQSSRPCEKMPFLSLHAFPLTLSPGSENFPSQTTPSPPWLAVTGSPRQHALLCWMAF